MARVVAWLCVVAAVAVANASRSIKPTAATTANEDIAQTVANVQAVTLTGRTPEVLASAKQSVASNGGATNTKTGTTAALVPADAPIPNPEKWYTRAQLLGACGMARCNHTEHCWGNPSGFLNPSDSLKPDGAHHEFCCVFCDKPIDPDFDSTKLVPYANQCAAYQNRAEAGWCVAGDDSGMTGPERCEQHGGFVVWNYHGGKLRQGAKPDGKCLTLAAASAAFHGYCDDGRMNRPGRGACMGPNGLECCGHGKCVWSEGKGWGCVFEPGYTAEMCFSPKSYTGPDDLSLALTALIGKLRQVLSMNDSLRAFLEAILEIATHPSAATNVPFTLDQMKETSTILDSLLAAKTVGLSQLQATHPTINVGTSRVASLAVQTNEFNTPPTPEQQTP